jgi:hypothetical protein
MTKYEIASLAYKLAGIFAIALAITIFPLMGEVFNIIALGSLGALVNLLMGAALVVPFGLMLLLGIALILRSQLFAERTFQSSDEADARKCTTRDAQSLAFSVVGIVLVGFAIPALVSALLRYYDVSQTAFVADGSSVQRQLLPQIIGPSIQALFGIGLFLGSNTVSDIWHRLRESRIPH